MTHYRVKWEIDIEAETMREATEQAWEIMKEPVNEATFLDVLDCDDPEKRSVNFDMDYTQGA